MAILVPACMGEGGVNGDGVGAGADAGAVVVNSCPQSVSARGAHTCVLSDEGEVLCWGRNKNGQLGIGSTDAWTRPRRVELPDGASADEIVTGAAHTCVRAGGAVYCWGYNADGAIGNGATNDQLSPVRVQGLDQVEALVAGGFHNCAIRSDQSLWCWGDNVAGQIGDGSTTDRRTPVQVRTSVQAVAAGEEHTCIVDGGGGVLCWGRNDEGQLGDGTRNTRPNAAAVVRDGSPLDGAQLIAAGVFHTCAGVGGQVMCWGDNGDGQVGNGSAGSEVLEPAVVSGLSSPDEIEGGELHTCARVGGEVLCWGGNPSGQLGTGDISSRTTPTRVAGMTGAADLGVGDLHSCAVVGQSIQCWGYNTDGQIGDGTFEQAESPVQASLSCQ